MCVLFNLFIIRIFKKCFIFLYINSNPIMYFLATSSLPKKYVAVASGKIPLCPGSRVYVAKKELMNIFIPNACIYTSRLSDLVFGLENLEKVAKSGSKDCLKLLDEDLLKSIISEYLFL